MSTLSKRIASLCEMTPAALRAEWRKVYRTAAPELSPDLLARGIAFRMQEKELGALTASLERRLQTLANETVTGKTAPLPVSTILRPGMQLVRSWRGRTHSVDVTEDGFVWSGGTYTSLSSVAHAITGTKWSGPRFFGLRGKTDITLSLEQEFNSLDAQREACAAFILSQRHEGWNLLPEQYDDGGFSGGNMNRPAMQQLLADVETGKVDVIVVYKVDRLTRSLADFAKIVEVLDAKGASFVSVTQAFNTTTSMGRLTLNVLLSFAQFEREVTGERIRDKIAASKKKGLWMGGPVPLGYEVRERKLVVHEAEAKTVQHLFRRYLEMSSVRELIEVLDREGVRTKMQIRASGPHRGGIPFAKGSLYYLLKNRTYLGEIIHKGDSYPGEHQAIVPKDLWDAVQEKLATNAKAQKLQKRARHTSLLAGLLHDGLGRRMSPAMRANRASATATMSPMNSNERIAARRHGEFPHTIPNRSSSTGWMTSSAMGLACSISSASRPNTSTQACWTAPTRHVVSWLLIAAMPDVNSCCRRSSGSISTMIVWRSCYAFRR